MKNLVTKRYRGYTYHVEANGDFYIACKKNKGKYIGFTVDMNPRKIIRIVASNSEDIYGLTDKKEMLRDAERIAKESKDA